MDEISLHDILQLIWRRKWILAGSVVLFLALGAAWVFFFREPVYQARVYAYLEKNDYQVKTYEGNYLSQLSSAMNRKIYVTNDKVFTYLLQSALDRNKDLPKGKVTVQSQWGEITFRLSDGKSFEQQLPAIGDTLNEGMVTYYRQQFDQLKEALLILMSYEMDNFEDGIKELEAEIKELEESGQVFLPHPSGQPAIHPYYAELLRRRGELQSLIYQLQNEMEQMRDVELEATFCPVNVMIMGHEIANQTAGAKMVAALALALGICVGLFAVYLLSLEDIRKMMARSGSGV